MLSDADRRGLFEALEENLGEPHASNMMELLPPVGWADVARRGDLAELRGEIKRLEGRIDALFPKLVLANAGTAVSVAALVLAAVRIG